MTYEQMKATLLTIKSTDFSRWYDGLSDVDRVLYKKVFDKLHKK